jgi:predicted ferric reductase
MNQYYPHLPSMRTITNGSLEQIGSTWQYIQTTLLNLWSSRMPGPSWKISSRLLWCCISLLCLHRYRQPSYHSWWKM